MRVSYASARPRSPPRQRVLILHSSVGSALLPRGAIVRRLDPTATERVQPAVLGAVEPAGVGLGLGVGVVVDGAVSDLARIQVRVRAVLMAIGSLVVSMPWLRQQPY